MGDITVGGYHLKCIRMFMYYVCVCVHSMLVQTHFYTRNPLILKRFFRKLSSGSKILLTETFELRMILLIICRRVVGNVLDNISPSNSLPIML